VSIDQGQIFGFLEKSVSQNEGCSPRERVSNGGVSVRRLSNTTRSVNSQQASKVAEVDLVLIGENGEFSLEGIPAGNYVVVFECEGLATNPDSNNQFTID
jgi:hypothetical protein